MDQIPGRSELTPKLVDSLYVEAMVLADEARSYFDGPADADREGLAPMARVGFACESLRVTTRLMHIIAWLLTQKAVAAGEISSAEAREPDRRLGEAAESDHLLAPAFPAAARELIRESEELYERVRRLDRITAGPAGAYSPALTLMRRLERSL
jgi:regulator of CtrA degradation